MSGRGLADGVCLLESALFVARGGRAGLKKPYIFCSLRTAPRDRQPPTAANHQPLK